VIPTSVVVLILNVARLASTQASDSVAEFRGIVQAGKNADEWKVALSYPITIGTLSVRSLRLAGERWSRYENRLVSAKGTARAEVGVGVTLDNPKLTEIKAPGSVSKSVSPMTSQRASLNLAVVPSKFSWTTVSGDSTGVQPAVVFSLTNQGDVPLEFDFPTNEVLCVSVRERGRGTAHWRYAWAGDNLSRRVTVAIGNALRWVVPIPREAADHVGQYIVEVSLCGARIYGGEAEFEVS
jgi:hypothetical protein